MLKELTPWIPLISLVVVVLTFIRTAQKDEREEKAKGDEAFNGLEKSLMKLDIKLDQVNATTSETRADIKSINKQVGDLDRRVTIVESKVDEMSNHNN